MRCTHRIREALAARGWTQYRLARAAGLSESYVSLLVRGLVVPSAPRLARVARALRVPVGKLDLRVVEEAA